jgi:3-hydroxyisobutyrate dehydrogenase-like beta-hydroxyacid dehydrogenase
MAAKLVNNALVSAHAQCAAEALLMAERLELLDENERVQNLFNMLKSSWGQSKVLELVGNDYLALREQTIGRTDSQMDCLRTFPTQAPLRNLKKDMNCVIHDLQHSFSDPTNTNIVRQSFPIFQTTSDCLHRACSDNKFTLSDSPFAALLIPIREEASQSDL